MTAVTSTLYKFITESDNFKKANENKQNTTTKMAKIVFIVIFCILFIFYVLRLKQPPR
jgi:hypothetical protein